jgi:hypothetical protein
MELHHPLELEGTLAAAASRRGVSVEVRRTLTHDPVGAMALTNYTRQDGVVRTVSGQWRAMPDGNDGIHGIPGNVVSVTYRF